MLSKKERLLAGETITTSERGNSMLPYIKSGQKHVLAPAKWEDMIGGEIVYCKVKGRYYTHFVHSVTQEKGCLIGNAKNKMNGWTKQVYGKVIEIL